MADTADAGEVRQAYTLDGKVIPFALEDEVRAHLQERKEHQANVDAQLATLRAQVASDTTERNATVAYLLKKIEDLQAKYLAEKAMRQAVENQIKRPIESADT